MWEIGRQKAPFCLEFLVKSNWTILLNKVCDIKSFIFSFCLTQIRKKQHKGLVLQEEGSMVVSGGVNRLRKSMISPFQLFPRH